MGQIARGPLRALLGALVGMALSSFPVAALGQYPDPGAQARGREPGRGGGGGGDPAGLQPPGGREHPQRSARDRPLRSRFLRECECRRNARGLARAPSQSGGGGAVYIRGVAHAGPAGLRDDARIGACPGRRRAEDARLVGLGTVRDGRGRAASGDSRPHRGAAAGGPGPSQREAGGRGERRRPARARDPQSPRRDQRRDQTALRGAADRRGPAEPAPHHFKGGRSPGRNRDLLPARREDPEPGGLLRSQLRALGRRAPDRNQPRASARAPHQFLAASRWRSGWPSPRTN